MGRIGLEMERSRSGIRRGIEPIERALKEAVDVTRYGLGNWKRTRVGHLIGKLRLEERRWSMNVERGSRWDGLMDVVLFRCID